MLYWIDNFLIGKPRWAIAVLALALIALLGSADRLTGYEMSFSVFYLVPITVAAWYGGRVMGFVASGMSAGAWVLVERVSDVPYSQEWILFWNTAVRFMLFITVAWLAAELRATLTRHQQLARTDNLTGLLNRAGFIALAEQVVAVASRYRHPTAFAYIDLDGFKAVNDTLGHSRGDDVLKTVGLLLEESSRESDLVARLGGDEFAVLLPNTGLDGARVFFTKLHERLRGAAQEMECPAPGFSIGAVVFETGPPSIDEALRHADGLMYRAKRMTEVVIETATPVGETPPRPAAIDP